MATIVLTHEVKDVDSWHRGFVADAPARASAGITMDTVARDGSLVMGMGSVANVGQAKQMVADPRLHEAMKQAGVKGAPHVAFLDAQGAGTPHTVAQLTVNDYAAWRKHFDEGASIRDKHGVKVLFAGHKVDDLQHVVVVSTVPSWAHHEAFMADPDQRANMAKGGATAPPVFQRLASV